jgi:GGDEF domain-containing protein
LLFGDLDRLVPDAVMVAIVGVGIALWSELMKRQHIAAVRDPLTGAFSRDFGLLRLRQALANGPFRTVVAVLDVERFTPV